MPATTRYLAILVLAACSGCARPVTPNVAVLGVEDFVAALEERDAAVIRGGLLTQPFFSVPAEVLGVNGERIQVFLYDDSFTAHEEAEGISDDGSVIGTTAVQWAATPHIYRACRLTVLYVGEDERVTQLLASILGREILQS